MLEVYLVEDLLDLHEEVYGVRFVGEIAVEDGLDHAVAIIAKQAVQILQTNEEKFAIGDVHKGSFEVIQDGKDKLTFAHKVPHLIRLLALLTIYEQGEDLHESG